MFTTVRFIVLAVLALILVVSAWSKLRFLDENSDQPQRWRLEEYPGAKPGSHSLGGAQRNPGANILAWYDSGGSRPWGAPTHWYIPILSPCSSGAGHAREINSGQA